MFGIGSTELLVILLVALIVLGPKSLASASRSLGKAMGEFRRVSTDFQRALNVEAAREEERQREKSENAAGEVKKSGSGTGEKSAATVETKEKSVFFEGEGIPDDSPLAQALAQARKEASAGAPDMAKKGNDSTRAGEVKNG